ncbi:O-methyltransferase [Camillea tinctor]|nr:O-methyltransferase [Camillea tinctor]
MPHPETSARISNLRKVVELLATNSEKLIAEWEKLPDDRYPHYGTDIPSHEAYNAGLVIKAAMGSIEELTSKPTIRLLEVAWSHINARCLHMAAELHVADILAEGGDEGVSIDTLSEKIGIEKHKLTRIMRALASDHIFRQVGPDSFANNIISQAMVDDEPVRSWVALQGLSNFSAVDHLPATLLDPVAGPSYEVTATAFNRAVGTELSFFDWLTGKVPASEATSYYRPATQHPRYVAHANGAAKANQAEKDEELVFRPEEALFNAAMFGSGRVTGTSHVYDYPWGDLGRNATVVDVGGGVGGFAMQLCAAYPSLRFIVQDQPAMIAGAPGVWQETQPGALASGRATLMAHDFFAPNPVKGADVYWFRHVLHNWPDKDATRILSGITPSMGPSSRVLLAEHVTFPPFSSSPPSPPSTTTTNPKAAAATTAPHSPAPAPSPLLANYGRASTFSNQDDLLMLTLFNSIERTPAEYQSVIEGAGLRLVKIWPCRSPVSIIECRLAGVSD